jgi:N-glycosylase/DNA lyase
VPREPAIIGIEGQWVRATGIIRSALASFGNIETFQAAAARQIDAADYALQLLIQDLSAAMPIPIPIPADGRALRAVLAEAAKSPTPAARPKKALAA